MKHRVFVLALLVVAVVFITGCTQTPAPAPAPAPTTIIPTQTTVTAEPRVTFPLGQEYLHKKYSFTGNKDMFTEQFRVTNDPWAIDITVNPTSTNPQDTWFEITATNIDTGHSQTFGYGRSNSYDRHLQFPMYNEGPYKFDMKGNLVSVDVIVAKRQP